MTTSPGSLSGRAAVITGAGSGIGEALAHEAAVRGMRVVLADIAADRIERVAADIGAKGGAALAVPTDVADPSALDRLADCAYAAYGDVCLLVNNAGIETLGFSWELSVAQWEQVLNVNIHGVVHGVRAFVPRMLKSPYATHIANVASIGGLGTMPLQTSYILSKHAVIAFSECLHLEMQLQAKPVNISVVLPGAVATRIFEDADAPSDSAVAHRGAMNHMISQFGMSAASAAKLVLDGICAGQFWISTHPEVTARMAQARAEHLKVLGTPSFSAEARQILNLP